MLYSPDNHLGAMPVAKSTVCASYPKNILLKTLYYRYYLFGEKPRFVKGSYAMI